MTPGLPESCDSSIHQSLENRNRKEGIKLLRLQKRRGRERGRGREERGGGAREDRGLKGEKEEEEKRGVKVRCDGGSW